MTDERAPHIVLLDDSEARAVLLYDDALAFLSTLVFRVFFHGMLFGFFLPLGVRCSVFGEGGVSVYLLHRRADFLYHPLNV